MGYNVIIQYKYAIGTVLYFKSYVTEIHFL
jgi:hypothetical protein